MAEPLKAGLCWGQTALFLLRPPLLWTLNSEDQCCLLHPSLQSVMICHVLASLGKTLKEAYIDGDKGVSLDSPVCSKQLLMCGPFTVTQRAVSSAVELW